MSIRIDVGKCTGCGKCIEVCPGNLLYKNEKCQTYIKYPRDCWGCTSCVKECQAGAIRYYLGADIGGKGSTLYIKRDGHFLHWHIEKAGGKEQVITINQLESNKY